MTKKSAFRRFVAVAVVAGGILTGSLVAGAQTAPVTARRAVPQSLQVAKLATPLLLPAGIADTLATQIVLPPPVVTSITVYDETTQTVNPVLVRDGDRVTICDTETNFTTHPTGAATIDYTLFYQVGDTIVSAHSLPPYPLDRHQPALSPYESGGGCVSLTMPSVQEWGWVNGYSSAGWSFGAGISGTYPLHSPLFSWWP